MYNPSYQYAATPLNWAPSWMGRGAIYGNITAVHVMQLILALNALCAQACSTGIPSRLHTGMRGCNARTLRAPSFLSVLHPSLRAFVEDRAHTL